MVLVLKFGGTSVSDGHKIRNIANYVQELKQEHEIVVVSSAMSKVTDFLETAAQEMRVHEKDPDNIVLNYVDELRDRHLEAIKHAIEDPKIQKNVSDKIELRLKELKNVLRGIAYLGELTPRSMDLLYSFGERLVIPIIAGSISDLGMDSVPLTGGEAGIITCEIYGAATPIRDVLKKRCRSKIQELLAQKKVPVVTGFIGESEDGNITTLGRGGSDYSASLIGASIGADEIWIMTDVNGILTADPSLVSNAKTIPVLSYAEAVEIAYFGAKVIHPKTIEPAMVANVPVRIKNTFNPNFEGTLIVHDHIKQKEVVKCISTLENVATITVSGAGMIGIYDVAARVFGALGRERVHIAAISQSSSEANITLVVVRRHLDKALSALRQEFPDTSIVKDIIVEKDVSLVAVVGAGMKGVPGVASRVFTSIGETNSNIVFIAQGSSELNITVGIIEQELKKAVEALHSEFSLA